VLAAAEGALRAGVTLFAGLLVARWRAAALGLSPRLPRLWHV
jgi:hypothetical protein